MAVNAAIMAGLLVLLTVFPIEVTSRVAAENKSAIIVMGSASFFLFAFPVIYILFKDAIGKNITRELMGKLMGMTISAFGVLIVLIFSIYAVTVAH